jgi:hypothetical protein
MTTNNIDLLHSLMAHHTDNVDYWKNSNQRQRWVATVLLDIEPGLRRIRGYRHLSAFRHFQQKIRLRRRLKCSLVKSC